MRKYATRFLLSLVVIPIVWQLAYSGEESREVAFPAWDHRLIAFVLSSEEERTGMEEMIRNLSSEISERDLLFVNLGEVALESEHALAIGSAEKELWRAFWELDLSESRFVLVGKDGGVKAAQRSELRLGLFFDLIDQMPMRIAEMRVRER